MTVSHVRRGLGAALVAVALMTVTAGAIAADVPDEDRVYPRNLPTHAQVAALYDGLDDGYREVLRNRYLQIRSSDCLGWGQGPRASSGRWAAYYGEGGSNPYFEGLPNPGPFVYKFHSRERARMAFFTAYDAAVDCLGEYSDDDFTVGSVEVDVPELGAGEFGVRYHETSTDFEDFFLYVWVREGRYVTTTMVQSQEEAPAKKPAIALTRVMLDRIP